MSTKNVHHCAYLSVLHSNSEPFLKAYSWYTCVYRIYYTTDYIGHLINLCLGRKLCTLILFFCSTDYDP